MKRRFRPHNSRVSAIWNTVITALVTNARRPKDTVSAIVNTLEPLSTRIRMKALEIVRISMLAIIPIAN